MKTKGLDIKGLDATKINQKLKKFISDYFPNFNLSEDEPLFQEGHLFSLDEISGMLPEKYFEIFTEESKFICMCGFFNDGNLRNDVDECFISLVLDESHEYAYLLCLNETDKDGEERTIVIKDFLH